MRSAAEVAKRCACVEITRQRAAIEGVDPEDAETLRAHYPNLVEALDLEDAILPTEAKALEASLGQIPAWHDLVGSTTLQCAVLLWALGRLERLPTAATVADGSYIEKVGAAAFLVIGHIDVLRASLEMAELRPKDELAKAFDMTERSLSDKAHLMQRGLTRNDRLEGSEEDRLRDLIGLGILAGLAWVLDPKRDY